MSFDRKESLQNFDSLSNITSEDNSFEFLTYSGKLVRSRTDLILPDGTRLNDPINSEIFDSIKVILNAEETRNESKISLPSIYGSLYLLVHWMYLKGVYRFEHLTASHLKDFKNQSADGLDVLIDATPRVFKTLCNIRIEDLNTKKRIGQILRLAHIPDSYIPKLVKTGELIKSFLHDPNTKLDYEMSLPQVRKLSKAHLRNRLAHIKLLWVYRAKLKSSLSFEPFPEGVWVEFQTTGREDGATKTIPIELIPNLVSGAINWIENYAPKLIAIHHARKDPSDENVIRLIEEFNNQYSKDLSRVLVLKTFDKNSDLGLKKSKRLTFVACLIVLHIFTARRASEISGLSTLSLVGEFNDRYLLTDIGKTQLRDEPIPCPEIVAVAFKTIIEMRGLDETYHGDLWEKNASGNHNNENSLDYFAEIIGAIYYQIDGVQHKWHYALHQFRRIFAILYVWRFEGPFSAIQHHLRHISWRQTFVYVRDKRIYNDVLSESISLTTKKLQSIASGEIQKPAGMQSSILKKHIERMRKNLDIADEGAIESMIKSYIEDRGLVLRPTAWGYCGAKSNTSNLRRAACQSKSNVSRGIDPIFNAPDGSGSSEELCAGCHFHFSDETKEIHWKHELEKIVKMEKLVDPDSEAGNRLKARKNVIQIFIAKYYD